MSSKGGDTVWQKVKKPNGRVYEYFSITVAFKNPEVADLFQKAQDTHGLNKSELIRLALERFFEQEFGLTTEQKFR